MLLGIKALLKCGICHEQYDTNLRKPTIYRYCSHTFCQKCLKKTDSYAEIYCPFKCGNFVGSNIINTNFALLDIVECVFGSTTPKISTRFFSGVSLNTICPYHEKTITRYDFNVRLFKCFDCKMSAKNSVMRIEEFLPDLKIVYSEIKQNFKDENDITKACKSSEKLSESLKQSCEELEDKIDNYINTKYFILQELGFNTEKFKIILEKFRNKIMKSINLGLLPAKLLKDHRENIEFNLKQCDYLQSIKYDLNMVFERQINFKPYTTNKQLTDSLYCLEEHISSNVAKNIKKLYMKMITLFENASTDKKEKENFFNQIDNFFNQIEKFCKEHMPLNN